MYHSSHSPDYDGDLFLSYCFFRSCFTRIKFFWFFLCEIDSQMRESVLSCQEISDGRVADWHHVER